MRVSVAKLIGCSSQFSSAAVSPVQAQAYGGIDFWVVGTGMLSRQDWVGVRGAAAGGAGRPRAPKVRSPRTFPQKILKN